MNAGALHPWAVRQVTTPRPCSPPTINPPFPMFGTTAMHLAPFSTSSGMPLSGAAMISFMTVPAACKRAVVSCSPGPAKAKVDKDKVNKAIAYFIKHFLFIPRYFVGQLVKGEIRPRDQLVRRRLMRLKIKINTATTNVAALSRQRTNDKAERSL